ncbi:PREDICTED: FK506-binding protein 5-like [Camelina sativa]|uniref:FK506-binding protein 5-like n=1 Tax=Camelina sativa TaxID=90675 RepID=A0ABM0UQ90_CAMSA|nr:PREDICTED: FK506-binding protein 5-like [Camelina sativa]XP_019088141.1 PREDICTED: FK506-binding protein 5-like [Camelina sativa]
MKKGAKKKGGSRGGRKAKAGSTSSASKNVDAVVETSTQETQPTQTSTQEAEETEAKVESPQPEKEGDNKEEAKENQEEEAEKVESKPAEEGDNEEEEAKEDQQEEAAKVESKPAAEEGDNEEEAKEDQDEEIEEAKPDSATQKEKEKAKGASSSQPPPLRRGKRKRGSNTEPEKKTTPRAKRAKATKAQEDEPEYFMEKRNLEDLWRAAFPVGTEWDQLESLYEFNWDFTNLEEALEEGGKLYGKKVYVFGCTESQSLPYKNETKDVLVPAVVCIESSIPPSDQIGVASVQGEVGEIVPMKTMKMAWEPYIPLEKRDRQVDKINFQINILGCTQRRSALKHLKDDRVKKFNYCLPYINNPYKVDESEQSTVVQIMFPSEPPVACEYDWVKSDIEEFTDNLIKEETLLPEQKDEFEEFVKEESDKAKTAYEEAQQARENAKEGLSAETKKAYQEMKLYKFYPLPSPDTPDAAGIEKSPLINRYFGKAHEVL